MQRGELEYLSEYSRELNSLLRLMVHPDPAARPSAAKLLAHHLLNPTITKSRYTHKSELDALSVVLMKTDLDPRWQKMYKKNLKCNTKKVSTLNCRIADTDPPA
jgi:hypothetical protein